MTQILPTATCFDDMIEYLELRVKADPPLAFRADFVLVHGLIDPPEADRAPGTPSGPIAHAWIEEGTQAHFSGIFCGAKIIATTDKDEYWLAMGVIEATRYTMRQVLDENRRSGHHGPWRVHYRERCT